MSVIEETGRTHKDSKFGSLCAVAEAKGYKTCTLAASALGALPWQEEGGIVTSPRHLHIISVDEGAVDGLGAFLTKTCGRGDGVLDYRVYNLERSLKNVFKTDGGYASQFRGDMMSVVDTINERAVKEKGSHVMLFSSLTMIASGLMRELFGPPLQDDKGNASKASADINKRYQFGNVMAEMQNFAQQGAAHVFWEAHLFMKQKEGGGVEESLSIEGKTGSRFTGQCRYVTRVRRQTGQKFAGSNCDKVVFETRPSLSFNANGRAYTESLEPQESDLTKMFRKLGLEVGGYKPEKTTIAEKNK